MTSLGRLVGWSRTYMCRYRDQPKSRLKQGKSLGWSPVDHGSRDQPLSGPEPSAWGSDSGPASLRPTDQRPPRVMFICHPFADDPSGNIACVRRIARAFASEGHLPIAPQLYLPAFLDEATERDLAIRLSLQLVVLADEVRIYGEPTAGMIEEIAEAERLGIPVVRGELP